MNDQISYEAARRLAEEEAKKHFEGLVTAKPPSWLREAHIEEENFWVFLKSTALEFTQHGKSWSDAAFVVSKRGTVMMIADHNEDGVAFRNYLRKISEYLKMRNQ